MQASFPNQNVVYSLAYSYLYGKPKRLFALALKKTT